MVIRREYPMSPIVGVSAAVFHKDQVLLVRRARAPLQGEWSLPGGAVELGETLEQAVLREIAEETGLSICVQRMLQAMDRIEKDIHGRIRYHYVLITFLCTVKSEVADPERAPMAERIELRARSDASDAQWVPVQELRGSTQFPLRSRTLDVILSGWEKAQKAGFCSTHA